MGKPRYDIEKIKQEAEANNLEFIEVIPGEKTKVHCKCKNCGADVIRTIDKWNIRKNCTSCNKKQSARNEYETRKAKFEEILNKTGYSLINGFVDDHVKAKIKHNECGYEYYVTPNHFKNGRRCPKCNGGSAYTNDTYKEKFFETHSPDEFELLAEYIPDSPMRIKHLVCGKTFSVKDPCRVANRGSGCPYCTGSIKKPLDILEQQINSIDSGEYQLISRDEDGYITLKHNCGKVYKVLAGNFLNKNWGKCPDCYPSNKSVPEIEILSYIKELGFNPQSGVVKTVNKRKYQIDIFIEELNIGFEFDGLYWHSAEFRDKNHLIEKLKALNSIDIRLVNIFEDEWKFKKDIVKDKIKNILGVSNEEKIFARKCKIKDVKAKDRNIFLNKYHIQGGDKAVISKGLFYNDKLVAVMSLSTLRKALGAKSEEGVYELSRFAASCNVVGGFSKLLKNIIKSTPEIKVIRTYADLRWSDKNKNVYKTNGFTLAGQSKPNYWYFDPSSLNRYHRFNFRKQELKNKFPNIYKDSLSEAEIMSQTKYKRIYDCGNLVYELKV